MILAARRLCYSIHMGKPRKAPALADGTNTKRAQQSIKQALSKVAATPLEVSPDAADASGSVPSLRVSNQTAVEGEGGIAARNAAARLAEAAATTAAAATALAGAGTPAAADRPEFSEEECQQVQTQLLEWYDGVHRVLPWRRNPHSRLTEVPAGALPAPADLDPQQFAYRVWVSEIMLQQTQVATVIAYFNRWVARWPNVTSLAEATQEEVNEVWAGLGYYRRARYLLEGAQHVMQKLGGSFPTTAEQLKQIPGIGPYTAAAVASIAFNDAAAAVDGNVIRVISRLRTLTGDPTKQAKLHASLATQLLDRSRPGCHNQAMMELGATVCKPANPECGACPIAGVCAARRKVVEYAAAGGVADVEDAPKVTDYPEKVQKAAKREQAVAVCVLRVIVPDDDGDAGATGVPAGATATDDDDDAGAPPAKKRKTTKKAPAGIRSFLAGAEKLQEAQSSGSCHYLLVQRPAEGLLAGLWEFPGVVFEGTLNTKQRRALADAYLQDILGLDTRNAAVQQLSRHDAGSVTHIFSHIRQTMHVEVLTLSVPSLEGLSARVDGSDGAAGRASSSGVDGSNGGGSSMADKGKISNPGGSKRTKGKSKRPAPDDNESGDEDEGGGAVGRPNVKWVSEQSMAEQGLSTGVRKALKLAQTSS